MKKAVNEVTKLCCAHNSVVTVLHACYVSSMFAVVLLEMMGSDLYKKYCQSKYLIISILYQAVGCCYVKLLIINELLSL